MDQIVLDSGDPLNKDFSDNVPTGKRAIGFLHTIEGTSDTGQALSTADLGQLNLDIFAKQRFNAPLGFFHHQGRIHEGTFAQTIPTAGGTVLTSFVPLYYAEESNGIPVQTVKDLLFSVEHDAEALDTVFNQSTETPKAAWRVLYSSEVPFNYVPEVERTNIQFSGADTLGVDFDESDIVHIYIREKESNTNSNIINRIDIQKDGRRVASRGITPQYARDGSVVASNVETPQGPWAHFSLMEGSPSGDNPGYSNQTTSVDIDTNASGTVQIVKMRRVPRSRA